MVPSGWKLTTFDKHIDLLSGFPFKSAQYTNNEKDIRLLRGDNIQPGSLRWRNVKRWASSEYKNLEKYHLIKNDFIIAMDRTWVSSGLKVAEVKQSDLPCLLVQRVSRIRSKSTLAQGLLRQYFSSFRFEQYVKSVQTETAVPHISAKQIKEFSLLLPPLPEQRKISQILSTWDKAISTTESLITNSQQQKKSLMQQLLTGKKRFAEFDGEWKEMKLSQVGSILSGGTPSTAIKEYWDGHLFWVTPTDITKLSNRFISNTNKKITSLGLQESSAKTLPKGSLLVCTRATIGSMAITEFEMTTNQGFKNIIPNSNFNVDFLFYLLTINQHKLISNANGSTFLELSKKDFENLQFKIPTLSEQQKIASVLTTADQEIDTLQQKLAYLKQEKKSLMQQLLTGKRRVVI